MNTAEYGRGTEALYRNQLPGLLETLARRSRVASVTASSEIEGIVVPDQIRAENIIEGRAGVLRTRDEQELAGYRDALDYVFQKDWRPLNVGLLLHPHRLLFGRTSAAGGRLKPHDNVVVDRAADGTTTVRFRPVPAAETEFAVGELVSRYRDALVGRRFPPILLIGLFALDLSVIHPFEDGNGRVTRVITNALLADAGYGVVRYVSLEQLVADSADDYYRTLLASTTGWHEERHDPWPWLTYFADRLATAYRLFVERTACRAPSRRGSANTCCGTRPPCSDSPMSGRRCRASAIRPSAWCWNTCAARARWPRTGRVGRRSGSDHIWMAVPEVSRS